MKMCTKCHQTKDESEYFIKSASTGYRHAQCKKCYREYRKTYSANHYAKYGDAYRERAKIRRAKLKRQNQIELIRYLQDKACAECGENDIRVLEFDHLEPPKKLLGIARAVNDGRPSAVILSEIHKCQILCANCHKKEQPRNMAGLRLRMYSKLEARTGFAPAFTVLQTAA